MIDALLVTVNRDAPEYWNIKMLNEFATNGSCFCCYWRHSRAITLAKDPSLLDFRIQRCLCSYIFKVEKYMVTLVDSIVNLENYRASIYIWKLYIADVR